MKVLSWRFLIAVVLALQISVQAKEAREVKSAPPPEYPELARRLNLHGIARVQVLVAPDGKVKEVKEMGGNPVLLQALVRAVSKWKYEPSSKSTTLEVRYDFR